MLRAKNICSQHLNISIPVLAVFYPLFLDFGNIVMVHEAELRVQFYES